MKKFFAAALAVLMMFSAINVTAFADTDAQANVYVTISDKDGKLVLKQEKITVTDVDNDGALTINDALYAAHEAKYEGGAAAGYEAAYGAYGLSLNKLWGTANGGSYGYYVNNQSAWSLTDAISEGDYINAFVYTDLTAWSDTYCYFDINTVTTETGKNVELTLSAAGYDENWNTVALPVKDAFITIDGEKTDFKTDEEGKAVIQIENGGIHVISATSDTQILVPPVCMAKVSTNATANVYVTISDKDGKLALAQEKITVSDTDKDGYLTINDALYAAHEAKYEGGAAAGYEAAYGAYGLSLNKLWGTANGGSYGYYVNNQSAWSLTDNVTDGDYINAFVYTDLTAWSDAYCYFNVNRIKGKTGEEIALTLLMAGYDENYNPITIPVEGAIITINGEKTGYKTGKDGKAVITVEVAGEYIISAVSDTLTLVPPVCKAEIEQASVNEITTSSSSDANSPETGDMDNVFVITLLIVAAFSSLVILYARGRRFYEK